MALLPNIGAFLPRASDEQTACNNIEAWLAWCKQLVGGSPLPAALRISGGNVTPTTGRFVVDTGGTPVQLAADTLSHIIPTNFPNGFRICVSIADASRTVTFKHQAAGNGQMTLIYGVDFVVASGTVRLYFELQGTTWVEMAPRGWGAMTGSEKSALGINDAAGNPTATQAEATAGTANDRNMTPLTTRQALVNKNWLASLPIWPNPVRDADALLYFDGANLYRATAAGANGVLAGALRNPFSVEAAIVTGTATEFAHGLGGVPALHFGVLRCVAAGGDFGFAQNNEITTPSLHTYATSTTVGYLCQSPIQGPGAGSGALTQASWHVVLHAWRG